MTGKQGDQLDHCLLSGMGEGDFGRTGWLRESLFWREQRELWGFCSSTNCKKENGRGGACWRREKVYSFPFIALRLLQMILTGICLN